VSWKEFLRGKRKRKDVCTFSLSFQDNLFALHRELAGKTYRHGGYSAFKINDPKPRDIHKATVRDRLVHHALHRMLYPYFDRKFIFDSYSCRIRKGTHKALNSFRSIILDISRNNTKTVWVLKCDVRKFFASIDHQILKNVLGAHVLDTDTLWLVGQVIDSFHTEGRCGVGLPLGNLTSQLFVNVYMNEFDQFMKRALKTKTYIRYADDFLFVSNDKKYLESLVFEIEHFLNNTLRLTLHPDKVSIHTVSSGIDFLGWVHFPHHRVLRTSTKRRMFKKLRHNQKPETVASYLGLLSHGSTRKLAERSGLASKFWA
jgi:retron-type reverse transcriptase